VSNRRKRKGRGKGREKVGKRMEGNNNTLNFLAYSLGIVALPSVCTFCSAFSLAFNHFLLPPTLTLLFHSLHSSSDGLLSLSLQTFHTTHCSPRQSKARPKPRCHTQHFSPSLRAQRKRQISLLVFGCVLALIRKY
jgi:hypothetical protein